MILDVPTLVSYVSQFMTLLPGDVIITGTPAGVGLGMQLPQRLAMSLNWGSTALASHDSRWWHGSPLLARQLAQARRGKPVVVIYFSIWGDCSRK